MRNYEKTKTKISTNEKILLKINILRQLKKTSLFNYYKYVMDVLQC